jgi:methylase of polypeptide subunit release factors
VTDNYRIGLLPPTTRDSLFSLYGSWPRTIEYDEVGVTWDNNTNFGVWGPSIDTLLIARGLNKVLNESTNFKTALEIGCGSGYLSKFILNKCKTIKSMTVNDINPNAINCAKENIQDERAEYKIGDGLKLLENKTFDLIVCNPPYIPRPNSIEVNQYEGVGVLNDLAYSYKYLNSGGVIVIGLSNLADRIVFTNKTGLKFSTIEEMEVPLKINNVLNNHDWIEYLQDRNLKKLNHNGYDFWHRIKVVAATNS